MFGDIDVQLLETLLCSQSALFINDQWIFRVNNYSRSLRISWFTAYSLLKHQVNLVCELFVSFRVVKRSSCDRVSYLTGYEVPR